MERSAVVERSGVERSAVVERSGVVAVQRVVAVVQASLADLAMRAKAHRLTFRISEALRVALLEAA